MIYSLHGKLIHKEQGTAVVECAGVGYMCLITFNTLKALPEIGKDAFLYTYMTVREDAVNLIGFAEKSELDSFKMLTSINGVGAKVALAILSSLLPEEIAAAVLSGDVGLITKAPGVGKKLAQRIILELNDKIASYSVSNTASGTSTVASISNENVQNAIDALTVLGYSPANVLPIISKLDITLPTEQLIALTLKELGKSR